MRSILGLAALGLAVPSAADASTCQFYSGGTIHAEIPLGCPVVLFAAFEPVDDPTTYGVFRNGQVVELLVGGVTRHPPRDLPVQVTVSTPPACDYHFETEPWMAWGRSLEIDGLQVGDEVSAGSVIVETGPCPSELDQPTNTGWLQCTPPNDYELCCADPAATCGDEPLPPPGGGRDDHGGCATSSPSLGIALALLALRRNAKRRPKAACSLG